MGTKKPRLHDFLTKTKRRAHLVPNSDHETRKTMLITQKA
jgi:hypothetical protein